MLGTGNTTVNKTDASLLEEQPLNKSDEYYEKESTEAAGVTVRRSRKPL